jgi:DNA primase
MTRCQLAGAVRTVASAQYETWLWDPAIGHAARAYLCEQRRIDPVAAKAAHVGFLPGPNVPGRNTRHLARCVAEVTTDAELIEQVGIMRPQAALADRPTRLADYPLGGGYLVFPVRDALGECIGFKYRAVPGVARENTIRYTGTPGPTGGAMFGFELLRDDEREVVVVEGEIDWLSHASMRLKYPHIAPAVGWLGKELTPERLTVVQRRFHTVHLAFDPDRAGWDGTLRAGRALAAAGVRFDLVRLPANRDANDVLVASGPLVLAHFFGAAGRESLLEAQARWFAEQGYAATDPLWTARSLADTAALIRPHLTPAAITRAAAAVQIPPALVQMHAGAALAITASPAPSVAAPREAGPEASA